MSVRSELRAHVVDAWKTWQRQPTNQRLARRFTGLSKAYLRALHDADPFSTEPADVYAFHRHITERRRRGYDHLQAVRSWRPDLPA
jgi:hypothetical protein